MQNKYIEFSIDNEIKSMQICDNVAILIGDNLSGKSKILNIIYKGFLGKVAKFYYDNNKINFSDYQVLYFSEFINIDDEIKLSKTSHLRQKLIRNLNEIILLNNDFKSINYDISNLRDKLFNLINNKTWLNKMNHFNFFNELKLKANLSSIDIETIIDKLLKIEILDTDDQNIENYKYSQWYIRVLFFNILLQYLDINDNKRQIILILDLPELYGTIKSKFSFIACLKEIAKNFNCILIFSSNDSNFIDLFKPNLNSINLIKNENIFYLKDTQNILINAVTLYSYLKSNYNDYEWYKSQMSTILEDEDIKLEKEFINNNCLCLLFISLLFENITLFYSTENIYYEIINDKLIYLYLEEKRMIYIFLFLKYYNKNIIIKTKNNKIFEKINWII